MSIEGIIDHYNNDKKSHLLKHVRDGNYTNVYEQDFKIFGSNYQSSINRKISDSFNIRQLIPTSNKKEAVPITSLWIDFLITHLIITFWLTSLMRSFTGCLLINFLPVLSVNQSYFFTQWCCMEFWRNVVCFSFSLF